MFVRSIAPDLYAIGLTNVFTEFAGENDWVYRKYYYVDRSSKATETDFSMFGFESVPLVGEGEDYPETDFNKGYKTTYEHVQYGVVVKYSMIAREDDIYSFLPQLPHFFNDAVRNTIEMASASILNNATSLVGSDGVALLSTSHPCIDGVQANRPAVAVDLNYTSLSDAKVAILQAKSWTNIPIIIPEKPILLYPPAYDPMVQKLLRTSGEPFSADNTINYLAGAFEPVMMPWLTDSDAWFIVRRPNPAGLKFFWRVEPSFRQYITDSNDNINIRVRMRFSCGMTDWRHGLIWGSPGAD